MLSAVIVLAYIFLGGLTSAIYNEVLQFFLIVLGFLPLVLLGLKDVGGWAGLKAQLVPVATDAGYAPGAWTDSWRHLGSASTNPMGVEWFGMVMGLGFVLSLRLLVHRLPGGPARHGRRIDDRGAPHAAHRRASRRCSSPPS